MKKGLTGRRGIFLPTEHECRLFETLQFEISIAQPRKIAGILNQVQILRSSFNYGAIEK